MRFTEIPTGQTQAAFHNFMGALGDAADVAVTRMNTDAVFAERMATYAINGGIEPSTSQQKARAIMSVNMFGIEEAMKHYGVNPSRRQLAALAEVPFSDETLTACKDTHVLVVVFPISILDIRGIVKKLPDQTLLYNQDWYNREAFANNKGETEWQLVRKTPITDSTSKMWTEQQALLSQDEETPKAQVMVYTIIGHFLATGEPLFEKVYVRCVDLASDGRRVDVGHFDSKGLDVSYWRDGDRNVLIGLSAARK